MPKSEAIIDNLQMKKCSWLVITFFVSMLFAHNLLFDVNTLPRTDPLQFERGKLSDQLLKNFDDSKIITKKDIEANSDIKQTARFFPPDLSYIEAPELPKESLELIALKQKVFLLEQQVGALQAQRDGKPQTSQPFWPWEYGFWKLSYLIFIWALGVAATTILSQKTKENFGFESR